MEPGITTYNWCRIVYKRKAKRLPPTRVGLVGTRPVCTIATWLLGTVASRGPPADVHEKCLSWHPTMSLSAYIMLARSLTVREMQQSFAQRIDCDTPLQKVSCIACDYDGRYNFLDEGQMVRRPPPVSIVSQGKVIAAWLPRPDDIHGIMWDLISDAVGLGLDKGDEETEEVDWVMGEILVGNIPDSPYSATVASAMDTPLADVLDDLPFDSLTDSAELPTSLIQPCHMVASDMAMFTALNIFTANPAQPLFVLDGNDITGCIRYAQWSGGTFRAILFALVAELEEWALERAMTCDLDPLSKISVSRQEYALRRLAEDVAQQERIKLPAPPADMDLDSLSNFLKDHELITCPSLLPGSLNNKVPWYRRSAIRRTTFIDKGTILAKCRAVPGKTRKEIEQFFKEAQIVRNACAHPSGHDRPLIEPEKLRQFLSDCHRMIQLIKAEDD